MYATLISAIIFLLTAATPQTGPRDEALRLIDSLRKQQAGQCCREEFQSIEAAFATAESLLQNNESENATIYYQLTLIKGKILEERLNAQSVANKSKTPDAQAAPTDGAQPGPIVPAIPVETGQPVVPNSEPAITPAPTATESAQPATPRSGKPPLPAKGIICGSEGEYIVKAGETLRHIGAKLGISWRALARTNHLDPKQQLKVGQKLKVDTRRIVPKKLDNGIVINIPDRTLYFFRGGELTRTIPVALGKGKVKDGEYDWSTPTGRFKITAKEKDPTWKVPPSIQKEMEEEGKDVITEIPPGKDNPLGKYAMKTSLPGILIHSTIRPTSISTFSSHGCIRVYPEQMEEFFNEVTVNTRGEIIYRPVKLAVSGEGRIYLEVHKDVYEKVEDMEKEVRSLIKRNKAEDRVDWRKVELLLKNKTGVPEDITL